MRRRLAQLWVSSEDGSGAKARRKSSGFNDPALARARACARGWGQSGGGGHTLYSPHEKCPRFWPPWGSTAECAPARMDALEIPLQAPLTDRIMRLSFSRSRPLERANHALRLQTGNFVHWHRAWCQWKPVESQWTLKKFHWHQNPEIVVPVELGRKPLILLVLIETSFSTGTRPKSGESGVDR